ncbi:DNA-processing protein DprA [bacterium]|nr:DNA-processing protein DprA [bacterium]
MRENLPYWVALNLVLGDNLRAVQKLLLHHSSVKEIFRSSASSLTSLGIDEATAQRLTSSSILEKAEKEIERLERKGYTVLTLENCHYPEYLREIFDPPYVLYCAGKVDMLKDTAVSVVGARKTGPYGRAVAERLAQDLASRGLVVVSGLARGIDSLAHWGALKEGKTVAVLGSGMDRIYPKENRKLFDKIIEQGAVITEFPPQSPPLGFHFPLRNRIISGLSLAVVVVEATRQSGSLISARLALEQNREVMAVPGNITSPLSEGTNWLIKTGAKLVESWEDVVEEFPSPIREQIFSLQKEEKKVFPSMDARERKIYDLLKPDDTTHIDELVEHTDFSVSELLSILLNMEFKGLVAPLAGKCYQRKL